MRIKCSFCGNEFEETEQNCPSCGAVNNNINKTASSGPRTIAELKKWFYETHGFTAEQTHIYIDEDCKEPACYGIYKDLNTGNIVVYKNKDTGERAIRYEGIDEQYAVNELYQLIQRQALRNGVDINAALNPGKITSRSEAINRAKNGIPTEKRPGYTWGYVNGKGTWIKNSTIYAIVAACIIFIIAVFLLISISPNTEWHTGGSSSGGSSGGSSSGWSSGGSSWDSGDWGSDWGYNINGITYI